jgi:hypothetical protein
MSEEMDKLNEQIQKEMDLDRRKKDVSEKDLTLREHRVNRDLDELVKNKSEIEQAKSVEFGPMTPETIAQIVRDNDEYMESARFAMEFICPEFKKIVPYFRKNLILIMSDTGGGKSTAVANAAFNTLIHKNPATGKPSRVLVISNEECPEDVYNRLTSLRFKWKYTNHSLFTEEQRRTFSEYIPRWAKDGKLTVISDVYQGIPGWTTTIEGLEAIFTSLLKDYKDGKPIYDSVIIDYYQNFKRSKLDPKLDEYAVQRKVAALLDQMRKVYPGPIVLMAQMKRLVDEDDTTPFNIRLKGSKEICDKASFICELTPENKLFRSRWQVWKSRFNERIGEAIYTGYSYGKYVNYSTEFQKSVASMVEKNLEKDKEDELGLSTEPEKEKQNDS